MSVVHEALAKLDRVDGEKRLPWQTFQENTRNGIFVFDLPHEIINDFYDLREYIRIANLRGQMRVISIASSVAGEGSATVATYLAFLMAGGRARGNGSHNQSHPSGTADEEVLERDEPSDQVFDSDFQSVLKNRKTGAVDEDGGAAKKNQSANGKNKRKNKILLVDANIDQPSVHRFFGLDPDDGLAEIIESERDWRIYARPIKNTNMELITAGQTDMNSAELLGSDYFRALVRQWRNEFGYILFNSPPVLQYVSSLSLAAIVDGVVLVIRAGQTRWEVARSAKRKLVAAHANLLGVTLNRHKENIPDAYYEKVI